MLFHIQLYRTMIRMYHILSLIHISKVRLPENNGTFCSIVIELSFSIGVLAEAFVNCIPINPAKVAVIFLNNDRLFVFIEIAF